MRKAEHTSTSELHEHDRVVLTVGGHHVEAEIVSTDFEGDGSGLIALSVDGLYGIVTIERSEIK